MLEAQAFVFKLFSHLVLVLQLVPELFLLTFSFFFFLI